MTVYEKLKIVQSKLKAPKGQYNTFGKYYYRNCEDIQEAVKPILNEVNATLILDDEIILIGDRYYIKATAVFTDCETGELISNKAYAREEADKKGMDSAQLTGSTSSYARKYALNGLFCIDDSKDSDTGKTKETLLEQFKSEIKRTGKSLDYFIGNAKVTKIEEMTESDLSEAINALKNCPSKKEK